jgi:hypothetical protein
MKLKMKKPDDDTMFVNYQEMDNHSAEIESFLDRGGRVIIRDSIAADSGSGISTWQNQQILPTGAPLPERIIQGMVGASDKTEDEWDRTAINDAAWDKYIKDAFVGSAIDRLAGRVAGRNFGITSHVYEIQEFIDELVESPINELYSSYLGQVTRKMVEYELFLRCTIHDDGFTEFDVIEPKDINGDTGLAYHGIVPHKTKATLPTWYRVRKSISPKDKTQEYELIPSIYHTYMPDLAKMYTEKDLQTCNATPVPVNDILSKRSKGFVKYGQYVLSWKHGVKEILRNVSKLRTIFEPLEDYKQNKRWRSDYMKALTSYFIFYEFEDKMAWYRWQALSKEKKAETGLLQPLRPADRLLLPPGVKGTIQSPNLPKLSGDDEDLLKWMATAANTPYDIFASDSKGPTYASTKSSRPFYMDYINDWQSTTEMFYVMDFFRFAFWVKSKLDKRFKFMYPVEICTGFKEKKPVFETKKIPVYKLISCNFPISQETALDTVANGVLGSKRGDLTWHLGISKEMQAKKLGIQDYRIELKKRAEEENTYPDDLVSNVGNSDMVNVQQNGGDGTNDKSPKGDMQPNGKPMDKTLKPKQEPKPVK